jgi:8-oxo-dGTP diphosphatase/2-hydroxy-dATP diphosphatase
MNRKQIQKGKRKVLTLAFVREGERILLGMKKRGFGAGRFNGFGGKVQDGETIEEAATRELFEESGIASRSLSKYGVVEFSWCDKPDVLEVHIFEALQWDGEPTESDEMEPQWFSVDAIPFKKMWSDDSYWLPLFLARKKFVGRFVFDEHDKVLEHEVAEITGTKKERA